MAGAPVHTWRVAPQPLASPSALQVMVSPAASLRPYSPHCGAAGSGESLKAVSTGLTAREPDGANLDVGARLGELHEGQVREMRDRMAADKDIRETLQGHHETISGMAARVDELLLDLRSEVPRLRQENKDLLAELRHAQAQLDTTGQCVQELTQQLHIEKEARQQSEMVAHDQLAELMKRQEQRIDHNFETVNRLHEKGQECLKSLQGGFEKLGSKVQELESALEQEASANGRREQGLANDVLEIRQKLDKEYTQLSAQGRHCAMLVERLDEKIMQSTPSLQKWVTGACMPRLEALEESLRQEVSERSLSVKRLMESITSGQAKVQNIQSKLDEDTLSAKMSCGSTTPRSTLRQNFSAFMERNSVQSRSESIASLGTQSTFTVKTPVPSTRATSVERLPGGRPLQSYPAGPPAGVGQFQVRQVMHPARIVQ